MSFTLRRSQSLKSLSVGHSSWSTTEIQVWDKRRSVSQLVEKYESCVDLTDIGREDALFKTSGLIRSNHGETQKSKVETLWRRYESLSEANHTLSRSISMDMLPQPDHLVTNASRSLFETKNAQRQYYASSPRLNVTPQAKSSPVSHITSPRREAPTGREKGYSSATTVITVKKNMAHQKDKTFETSRRRTFSGVPGYVTQSSRGLIDEKRRFKADLKESSYQEHKQTYTYSPTPTVKDRSTLYLSKVATADFSGFTEKQGSVVHEHFVSSGKKKQSKFLSTAKEMCSACLTPVYPMEKMVADKLILHNNCFCCKYCQKRLSIHNYSALYGEFYCMSHYQQLFKKKGNYDEGFGHKQHKDRWLTKSEEPKPTSKISSAHTTDHTHVDGPLELSSGPMQSRRYAQLKNSLDTRNKLKISWPPEIKGTKHSPISQSNSSASGRKTDWSNHNQSSARFSSRNSPGKNRFNFGLDEIDKSVQLSPCDKANTFSTPSTLKVGVKAPHSKPINTTLTGGTKSLQKAAFSSAHFGTKSKVPKSHKKVRQCLNSDSSRPDSVIEQQTLAEDWKIDTPTKKKKTVRFASNFNTEEKNNMEVSSDEFESSAKAFDEPASVVLNGDIMAANRDNATLKPGKETEESPLEDSINNRHCNDSKTSDGPMEDNLPPTGIQEIVSPVQSNLYENTKADEEHISEQKTILNLDELQGNDIADFEKETFKPISESCDFEQDEKIKNEKVIETETNTSFINSKSQEPTKNIRDGSKEPDVMDIPPKTDEKRNMKVADNKVIDKANKGSWSKGKSPLSKLFPPGSNGKNKSESKTESKRHVSKPRNVLSRLVSSTENDLDILKTLVIKTETATTACEEEQEKVVETEEAMNTALSQDNFAHLISLTQNTPHGKQNSHSDDPVELNATKNSENPISLPSRSPAEVTVPSMDLDPTEQVKPLTGGFVEIDSNEALMSSQESIHVDLTSVDFSKPTSLEGNLNSSFPHTEDPGFPDATGMFTSQVMSPKTEVIRISDSDTLNFTNSGTLTDITNFETPSLTALTDIESSFIQEDPFGEKTQGESGSSGDAIVSQSVNLNEETLDIFGSSESNIMATSYGFENTQNVANETSIFSGMTDKLFGVSNAPVDIFGGDNMLMASEMSTNFFDIMTNSESQSQNPFEPIANGQPAPNGALDLISSESNPSTLSNPSNVFGRETSDLEQTNLIQSEVNNVFNVKGNQSDSNVFEQNLSDQGLIQSTQMEAFDLFSSVQDPPLVGFGQRGADPFYDPFQNDIFATTTDSTGTNTFSVETTQTTANLFDDFTGLESHSEAAETKESILFHDDIFSSISAMPPEPAQEFPTLLDATNTNTNIVQPQSGENDWMSELLG